MTYVFDQATHSSLGDTTTTEDLHGIAGCFLSTSCDVHLQKTDRTVRGMIRNSCLESRQHWTLPSKILGLFLVWLHKVVSISIETFRKGLCLFTILHIWWVMFSSHDWQLSNRAIIPATLLRTTAWALKGFPNALRWLIHLKKSSVSFSFLEHVKSMD